MTRSIDPQPPITGGQSDEGAPRGGPAALDRTGSRELPHRVVRASAGSGKTHRLALRYLEILFSGGASDSIVAATFTREAAGEILGRVLTRLATAAGDGGEAARLGREIGRSGLSRRHAERALRTMCDTLDRVVVSTLDSFFFRLTAALRFELGLVGVPAVAALDDPLLVALREEALERTLAALAERDWRELVDLFERLHGTGARRSVARTLDALLLELYEIYLEAPDGELWGRLDLAPGPDPATLASALDQLDVALRASAPGALRKALAADLELARRGEWDRLLERGLAGRMASDAAATRFGQATIPAAWRAALAVLVAQARYQVLAAQVGRTRATHRLLDVLHQHYWELRRRRGVLLFSDLATGLVRWLEAAPADALDELYYGIDARVGHLLLDEFQDTSHAQWSVLRPIAEEIRAWGDGSRTIFCVGDPKQAIYGWRGGCADLFDQIEEDLALDPASGERLEESFRSSQVVLDAVNLVFGRLTETAVLADHAETVERWSAAFGAHRARSVLPGYVELVESPAGEDHGEWAARRVAELAASMPAASIAVLVQTNEQASATLDALRRQGTKASGEGGGAVADDPAVAAVIAALVLADHPGDTIAAFHVAGSPIGAVVGLTGPVGRGLGRGDRGRGELRAGVPDEVLLASRRVRQAFAARGAAELIGGWRRALRGATDRRSRMRLAQAVDLAERFDREGGGRPGDLAAILSRSTVESPRHAGVRVMTVHRAKGLEFDLVVLPALERPLLRGPDAPVYLLRRSPLAPVEAVHRSAPASVRRLAPELEEGFEQERARRLRDDLSVLYVALTRARHALHLWLEPAPSAASGGGGREVVSFAAILRGTLLAGAGVAGEAPDASHGEVLHRAGDRAAVAASLAARTTQRVARQAVLPLSIGASVESPALRPAVGVDDLALLGELRAAEVLAPAVAQAEGRGYDWREVEAWIAASAARPAPATRRGEPDDAPATPPPPSEVGRARDWLLAGGRRVERLERDRRFACSIGGTTVTGELARLWIASGPGLPPRALVGGELAHEAGSWTAGSSAAGGGGRPAVRKAELLRVAAARAAGALISSPGRAPIVVATASVAVLLRGSGSTFLSLPS